METYKTSKSKRNSEQKIQSWRNHNTWIQTILQSYRNKNCIVLAKKKKKNQTERPMDQNGRPDHKPMHLQLTDLWQRNPKHTTEKIQPLQQMLLGKLESSCRRLKVDPCFSTCTKINSMWIKDLNIRPETLKQFQETVGNTLEQICIGNDFLSRTQEAQYLRERMNK
jgi:hypothetical protein